jgi:hypothetical protein
MTRRSGVFRAHVTSERQLRLDRLRNMSRKELLAHRAVLEERSIVAGIQVIFTTVIEPNEHGRLFVGVRSDEQRFLGIVSFVAMDGYWLLADGTIAAATEGEVGEHLD